MNKHLPAFDQTPLNVDSIGPEEDSWLTAVRAMRPSNFTIRLGGAAAATDSEPIVSRDADGRWRAGRYIGELAFQGRRINIRPRLGELEIERWLAEVLNLVAVPETAARQESASFIARLMAAIWSRSFDNASRHGPPAIRRKYEHQGFYVRGRLDVRRTARLRGAGSSHLGSVSSGRDLDNEVSRVIVGAERVLSQRIGNREWHTPRVAELLPQIQAVVGTRPTIPRRQVLDRIRYSPITRPFKAVAELSRRIAQLEGFGASSEEGQADGLLLDVAELWELYVLGCVTEACPHLTVRHSAVDGDDDWLLHSRDHADAPGLGRLRPDVLVLNGKRPVAVLDAKYKRLLDRWPERPQGLDRGDLYQLTTYMSRYGEAGAMGALIYPQDPKQSQADLATAERYGPWLTEGGKNELRFQRLAIEPERAVAELRQLFGQAPGAVAA